MLGQAVNRVDAVFVFLVTSQIVSSCGYWDYTKRVISLVLPGARIRLRIAFFTYADILQRVSLLLAYVAASLTHGKHATGIQKRYK